jgi:hypothetical protein
LIGSTALSDTLKNKTSNSIFTINLSSTNLTENQKSLLEKGLTYIPTYKSLPLSEIYETQYRLIRSLKLRDFFFEDHNKDYDFNVRTFTNKSNWTPADHLLSQSTLDTIQNILNITDAVVRHRNVTVDHRKLLLRHFEDNLTVGERSANVRLCLN